MTVNQFVNKNILNENSIILAHSSALDMFWDWLEETKERNISKFFENNTEAICTIGTITMYAPVAYLQKQYARAEVYSFCIREPWIVVFIEVAEE